MAVIGYARVSTEEQNLDLQRDALCAVGCDVIIEDLGCSAAAKRRPEFERALALLKPGDTFVIWKMDRAFRSLKHALETLDLFEARQVEFRSLTELFDTATPMGRCMYQVRNAFAELERNLISERTKAGMAAARRRGVCLGRPRALSAAQVRRARSMLRRRPENSLRTVAASLDVSIQTLRRAVREI